MDETINNLDSKLRPAVREAERSSGSSADARSPLASPLLPKGEANAKGEDSLPQRFRQQLLTEVLSRNI
ncbi:hypothetical protein [Nostoc sp.]|uniref:hypothetical protein n=1 Tax=Nostoc sp. TaxID=1180 RepID=UPI002FF73E73